MIMRLCVTQMLTREDCTFTPTNFDSSQSAYQQIVERDIGIEQNV